MLFFCFQNLLDYFGIDFGISFSVNSRVCGSLVPSDAMDYISWHCSENGGKSKHQNWWLWQKYTAEIEPFSH